MVLDYNISKRIKIGIISTAAVVGIGAAIYFYSQTAGCSRQVKTIQSSFDDGLIRIAYVYSMDGELLSVYAGKFDIDYDQNRIVFDDEYDKRHQIFTNSGTVITDEINEEEFEKIKQEGKVKIFTKDNSQAM